MTQLDETHDATRRSWVQSANVAGCDFPLQNLPFGVFVAPGAAAARVGVAPGAAAARVGVAPGAAAARVGVAIGDRVLDVAAAMDALGIAGDARVAADACRGASLNALAALGRPHWRALRRALFTALLDGAPSSAGNQRALQTCLHAIADCELRVPFAIGDYTDFYSSKHHATNVGRLFRPDAPLTPNYEWVPIGYHGRASSVVISGTPFARPNGQTKPPNAPAPVFGPSQRLDYEVELGFFIGTGNPLGAPISIANAREHIFGSVLLCDWSARDVQAWEYQPLGPFLAKSFATSISPWVVTLEALAPFACAALARAADEPAPLAYLADAVDQSAGGFEIEVEMYLASDAMRAQGTQPLRLSRASYRDAFWTPAQLVAHHASNGCNLMPGDLLGSGTISGATPDSLGSLLELTRGGTAPIALPGGETRVFMADGDEATQRARCTREGFVSIGFGELRGRVLPAPPR